MRGRSSLIFLLVAGCGVARSPGQINPARGAAPSVTAAPESAQMPAPAAPAAATGADATVIRPGLALTASQFPFDDPTSPEERLSGRFFLGRWTSGAEGVQQEDTPPSAAMTFRRYTGAAFGSPGGTAPAHYRVDVELQAYDKAKLGPADIPGSPVGALAVIPYFRDTTHYVLLAATPTEAQVWVVDGLRPGDEWDASKHRRWLYTLPTPIGVGDTIKWGAEVDTTQQSIKIYLNGELKEHFNDPFLTDAPHSVALMSNGNQVRYTSLELKTL